MATGTVNRAAGNEAAAAAEREAKAARGAEGGGGAKMAGREAGAAYVRSPDGTVRPIARGDYGDALFGGRPGTAMEGKSYRASDVNDYLGMGNTFGDRLGNFGLGMLGVSELDPRQWGASMPGEGADYGLDLVGTGLGLATGIPGIGTLYREATGGWSDINLGPHPFGDVAGGLDGFGGGSGYARQSSPSERAGDPGYERWMFSEAERKRKLAEEEAARKAAEEAAAAEEEEPEPETPTTPEAWYTIRGMADGGPVYYTDVDAIWENLGMPRLDRWYSPGSDWKPSLYYNNDLGGLPADYKPTNIVTWGTGDRIGPGIHNPTSTPTNPTGQTPTTPPPASGGGDDDDDDGGLPSWQQIQGWLSTGWRPTKRQVQDYIGAGGTIPGRGGTGSSDWPTGGMSGVLSSLRQRLGFADGGVLEVDGRMLPVEEAQATRLTHGFMVPAVPIRDDIQPMPILPPANPGKRPDKAPDTARAKAIMLLRMHGRSPSSGRVVAPGGGRDDMGLARHVSGEPIALADGEYVMPADYVSALGQGSTDEGARVLDAQVIKMRNKEAARLKSLPPPKR